MTAARRTRTRARCNIVLVLFLNCNTRSFNNQVNKIFVEHFTWFSSYLYVFTSFYFLQNLTTTQNRPPIYLFAKLTSNKLFGFIYFRYFRSVFHQTAQEIRDLDFSPAWTRTRLARALISYELQKSSGRIRYTTTTITSFKRRRRGSLKHSTRKGRSGQAARRSQLLHASQYWFLELVKPLLYRFTVDMSTQQPETRRITRQNSLSLVSLAT
uniref:(northern house mosquito) hypothetical protein n=1 Tax=Culex pipiens TaxID=7175 RepID=A0A8D8BCL4_CULPI